MSDDLDSGTINYYADNANTLVERYAGAGRGIAAYFPQVFLKGVKVLDIGCGSGRDMMALLRMEVDVSGVDACEAMLSSAMHKYPELKHRLFCDSLPLLDSVEDDTYDGVLCSAVLMHLPEEQLFDAAFTIRRIIREGGVLLVSIPGQDETIDTKQRRDVHGRLFNGVTPEKLQFIFERLGFRLTHRWENEDGLGRSHRSWHIMSFRLHESDGSRSLDKIEAVLNKDKKVATYKPALFRALAELAMTNYQMAQWLPDGKLSLPISAVSEKWVEYYWPIFESDVFIQQLQGEIEGGQGKGKSIAFRGMIDDFIQDFSTQGGLAGFLEARRSQTLSREQNKGYRTLLSKLNQTIKDGPVKHSGGVHSGMTVFSYDTSTRSILMEADLWSELSMMGKWIQDATILRWAELTEKISNHSVKASLVIDCLLTQPSRKREVDAARGFYLKLPESYCVWSEKKVTARNLAVDHAIPYALWKNNNLWNLFPTDEKVNSSKSDKLPTHTLIQQRKELIIHNWAQMHERFQNRFEYESQNFAGRNLYSDGNWENRLFACFSEAIEVTAIQRGVQRWEPPAKQATGAAPLMKKALKNPVESVENPVKNSKLQKTERPRSDDAEVTAGEASLHLLTFNEVEADMQNEVLPFVGKIAAGAPFSGFDHENLIADPYEFEWIEVPSKWVKQNRFIIQVAGDSMEPTIQKGDYLICEYHRHRQPGQEIVIMADFSYLEQGVDAVKRISESEAEWIFLSDNSAYDPIRVSKTDAGGEFPILGTVLYNLTCQQKVQ